MNARKQVTHVNGLAIIERQPALVPHPHPGQKGKLVPTAGVEHILLEDGTETEMCVECGYVNESGRAVVAHMSGKHSETRGPTMYPEETMRTIVREVLRAKKTGARNFNEIAADALNALGVKMAQGDTWTSASVSHLYNAHHARYPDVRARTIKDRVSETKATPVVDEPPLDDLAEANVTQEADETAPLSGTEKAIHTRRVRRLHQLMTDLQRELVWFDREWAEMERKAKAYDKLKETMQGL